MIEDHTDTPPPDVAQTRIRVLRCLREAAAGRNTLPSLHEAIMGVWRVWSRSTLPRASDEFLNAISGCLRMVETRAREGFGPYKMKRGSERLELMPEAIPRIRRTRSKQRFLTGFRFTDQRCVVMGSRAIKRL